MILVLLVLLAIVFIIMNIIGVVEMNNQKDAEVWYGLSLVFIVLCSVGLGANLKQTEPIKQYQTKKEWKPRLQINEQNNKKDTIYIYNLKDTVK